MLILIIYTKQVYIDNSILDLEEQESSGDILKASNQYSILLVIGTIYPAIYSMVAISQFGLAVYLNDLWKIIDLMYIIASIS